METTERKRNYTWLLHIGIWVVIFGMPFFSPRPGHPLHGGVEYSHFVPVLISFVAVFYINYLLLIPKYVYSRKFWKFVLWNALLIAAVSVLVHFTFRLAFPPSPMDLPPFRRPFLDKLSFTTRNTVIYIVIVAVAVAVKMTGRWYESENRQKELERAHAEAELENLKSQVNPHFLFNTLNNIYSLIQIDQDKAQEAVHDLSGMLRYMLYESVQETVPLDSEISFIRDYVKLMSMRLNSGVKLEISLPEEKSETRIAPMLFIPLIENAFKHGVSDTEESYIRVNVHEEGSAVTCTVENSCYPKDDTDRSGSGIGISNLTRRLDMLYPGRYSFEHGKVQNSYSSVLKVDTSANVGI